MVKRLGKGNVREGEFLGFQKVTLLEECDAAQQVYVSSQVGQDFTPDNEKLIVFEYAVRIGLKPIVK